MKQITIITPNEDGLLANIASTLGEVGINIESIDAMEVQERAIITLTCDRYDAALLALRNARYHAYSEDAQIINIKDEPGALAKVTLRLRDGGVHLRSIRLLYRHFGEAIVAVAMEPVDKGMELIQDLLIDRSK